MDPFKNLLAIVDKLLSPEGCPWDREQTFFNLQPYLLEEVHELLEAIDAMEGPKISEELGDVLYTLIFIAKLGEKQGLFTLNDSIRTLSEKLVRRHPHVFGSVKAETSEEIVKNWETIKKGEFKDRKSALDGIPPKLPALPKAQKIIRKINRAQKTKGKPFFASEEELGKKLWEILEMADGLSAEDALRRVCSQREKEFREREKTPEMGS